MGNGSRRRVRWWRAWTTTTIALAVTGCTPAPPTAPEARLIAAFRDLADAGRLGDPQSISATLGTTLRPGPTAERPDGVCSTGGGPPRPTTLRHTAYSPSGDFWYGKRPEGGTVDVPNLLMQRVFRSEAPGLSYAVTRSTSCFPGQPRPEAEISAVLEFSGVPGYACITDDRLKALLPAARFEPATDGAWLFGYTGLVSARTGVDVTFVFAFGQRCLLDVRIEQDPRFSAHSLAARRRLQACRRGVDAGLPKNSGVGPDLMMRLQAEAACGAFWDYLPGGSRF